MIRLREPSGPLISCIGVLGLLAALAGPSGAAPTTNVMSDVTRGARVRLTLQSDQTPEAGIFESLERDTLFLWLDRDMRRHAAPVGSIRKLERGEGYRTHKWTGTKL